jgi:hypothetical protein
MQPRLDSPACCNDPRLAEAHKHGDVTLSRPATLTRRRTAHKASAFRSFPIAPQHARLATSAILGVTIAGLGALWVGLAAAPAECRMPPMLLRLDTADETILRAASGVPCTLTVEPGEASVEALTVEKSPNYGGLVPRGRTGVIYRSMPGFKGDDDFTIALKGKVAAHAGEMRIRAKVVVR